jgi:hypothetical protein
MLFILSACLPVVALAGGDFYEGYKESYRYVEGPYSIAPLSPIPSDSQ